MVASCQIQRGRIFCVPQVRVRSALDQGGGHTRDLVELRRQMQGGRAALVTVVWVSSGLEQRGHDGRIRVVTGGYSQSGIARSVPGLQIGAGFDQRLGNGGLPAVASGKVQRYVAELVPRFEVSAGPQAFLYPVRCCRLEPPQGVPVIAVGGGGASGTRNSRCGSGFGRRSIALGSSGTGLRDSARHLLFPGLPRMARSASRVNTLPGRQACVAQERCVGFRRAGAPDPVGRPRLVAELAQEFLRLPGSRASAAGSSAETKPRSWERQRVWVLPPCRSVARPEPALARRRPAAASSSRPMPRVRPPPPHSPGRPPDSATCAPARSPAARQGLSRRPGQAPASPGRHPFPAAASHCVSASEYWPAFHASLSRLVVCPGGGAKHQHRRKAKTHLPSRIAGHGAIPFPCRADVRRNLPPGDEGL